jgi:hypothetical protein
LRGALERLGAAIDALSEAELSRLPGRPSLADARDAYVEVVDGVQQRDEFVVRWLADGARSTTRRCFVDLMEAQRWRLAMFASDGWFWDDPIRSETKQNLRFAARAARLVDARMGSELERSLVADLALFSSPSTGRSGAEIYVAALREIGQPGPE